jgi:arylsulfatase A-like enzyme
MSMGRLLWDDARRATAAALVGCAAAAVGELAATLLAAPDGLTVATALRLAVLDLALFTLVFAALVPALAVIALLVRGALWAHSGERARQARGLLAPSLPYTGPRASAAWLWGGAVGALFYVFLSTRATRFFMLRFKEQELSALTLSGLQLALGALAAALAFAVAMLVHRGARRLHRRLGRRAQLNPFGQPTAAALVLALVVAVILAVLSRVLPQLAPLLPWRYLLTLGLLALGAHATTHVLARRGSLLPRARVARAAVAGGLLAGAAVVVPLALVRVGADPATKSLAVGSSPPLRLLIDGVRLATDYDGDGFGTLLGENDCAPHDPYIHRLARDLPDNGIDENCDGRDFQMGRIPSYRSGQHMPVPEAFLKDWNVLLITIDTVRYDHTNMGGYPDRSGRDTTPNLAKLASRSVSFTFANAPSAGTMASVPAIITSKFFHSGLALDEKDIKKGMPPRLKEENLLISELFKSAGYTTGALLTHEYFNDFGMQQGFDTYDNQLGHKPDPYGVTSDKLTDHALGWIGEHADQRWFLWTHYLDPHGRYVAHPGETSYGTTEEDLYDGELSFTDKHIGRLLDELARLPGAERTIIVLTSDHGDGFNEHGFINHGFALYRELLHVPLIVYVPNIEPRQVDGTVSPLDIVPTLVDLCRLKPPRGAEFEGESLVPQLFYQQDAGARIVFSETNAPRPLRAVVNSKYKLIYDIKQNVYELYDLTADPWEKKNVWLGDKAAFETMKRYMDDWLERVYYSRDATSNQAMTKLSKHLLDRPPTPQHRIEGASADGGTIEVVGWGTPRPSWKAGEKIELDVFFHAARRPSGDFMLQIEASRPGASPAKTPFRAAAGGLLPTSRWRDGEHIADDFKLRIPDSWADPAGATITLGLRLATSADRKSIPVSGKTVPGEHDLLLLGTLPLEPGVVAPAPPKPPKPSPKAPKK